MCEENRLDIKLALFFYFASFPAVFFAQCVWKILRGMILLSIRAAASQLTNPASLRNEVTSKIDIVKVAGHDFFAPSIVVQFQAQLQFFPAQKKKPYKHIANENWLLYIFGISNK